MGPEIDAYNEINAELFVSIIMDIWHISKDGTRLQDTVLENSGTALQMLDAMEHRPQGSIRFRILRIRTMTEVVRHGKQPT